MDECVPGEPMGELFGWSCGCRKGYRCDLGSRTCQPGCSNDRQCCETWEDENENWQMDEGEITLWEGCESWCDGDDPEEFVDCMASFECINPGDPDATFGGPCEHDSHCPADGICLSYTDRETGKVYFPGGYCTRMGCAYAGRGCEDAGGACLFTGSLEYPSGMCVRPCHVETPITDPEYVCRAGEGEQVCMPVFRMGWVGGPPETGEDGYCWPGNFADGILGLGETCGEDESCASPRGLGMCMTWFADVPFCTVRCSEYLAEEESICGAAAEGEISPVLCGWGVCWEGCTAMTVRPGMNDCSRDDFACAPLSYLGTTYVPEGSLRPPGVCMPACDSDLLCEDIYDEGATCDTISGLCLR
jgi:hypothetical protein